MKLQTINKHNQYGKEISLDRALELLALHGIQPWEIQNSLNVKITKDEIAHQSEKDAYTFERIPYGDKDLDITVRRFSEDNIRGVTCRSLKYRVIA